MSLLDDMDTATEILAFRPERAGESVEGVVVALDVTTSEYTTDDIPVITLESDGVLRGVRGYHTTLRNDLAKLNLKVGDTLAIRYDGKKATKDGKRSFHSYVVKMKRGSLLDGANDDSDVAPF